MRTILVVIALVVCLGMAGLGAQSPGDDLAGSGPAVDQQTANPGSAEQGQAAGAASSSEDEFFGSAQVEAPKGTAENANAAEAVETEHVGLSGQLQAMSTYTVARSYVNGSGNLGDNSFANIVGGDFLVDMRLQKGFKAFLDLNLAFIPAGTPLVHDFTEVAPTPGAPLILSENPTTGFLIKEAFLDFNIANTAYFRAGKQVLKWGTGYFWHPSDLINIEHESFTNPNALLEGVFGLRSDVVFAPWWHLYTFTNLNSIASDIWDTAFAARSEFLAGSTEFAVSSWLKSGKVPVFGGDLSTPLPLDWWAKDGHTLNLTAEGTISYGDIQSKFDPVLATAYSVTNQLVEKVDVGLSRTFDALNVSDRVTVELEFFYNSDGYSQNMLDPGTYPIVGAAGPMAFLAGNYFQSGYYGQYYGAAFITINDFGTTNMTLTLSGLANFSDLSGTVLAGWSWSPVNNFTLQIQLGSYLGAANREYTVAFNPTTFSLTSGNSLFGIVTATVAF